MTGAEVLPVWDSMGFHSKKEHTEKTWKKTRSAVSGFRILSQKKRISDSHPCGPSSSLSFSGEDMPTEITCQWGRNEIWDMEVLKYRYCKPWVFPLIQHIIRYNNQFWGHPHFRKSAYSNINYMNYYEWEVPHCHERISIRLGKPWKRGKKSGRLQTTSNYHGWC
jgi:hypothetical protein